MRGGAEVLYDSLRRALERRGHRVELVTLPFNWRTREAILESALAWRLIDLEEVAGQRIDLVIATRFPSYVVSHPRKVVWLIHQFRQIYDLAGTPYSDFGEKPEDVAVVEMLRELDRRTLGEARRRFAISKNVADRLQRHCGLEAEVLYPPPPLAPRLRAGPVGHEVVAVGRLDRMKRFDLLVRALAWSAEPWRAVIVGEGPEEADLRRLGQELGVADRLELTGRLSDEELARRLGEALAVFYAPHDEDYGYVTVEAMLAGRAVVTTADAGGVLEFVRHGENGFVSSEPDPRRIAELLDLLYRDRELAARLGRAGTARVAGIGWEVVVQGLLNGAS